MRDCLFAAQVVVCTMWPFSAYAAQATLDKTISEIAIADLVVTLFLSTIAGVTALLAQMKNEYEAKGEITRMWLFVASNMTGSNLAGLIMYFTADFWGWHSSMQAGSIILAAFGGTWLIEHALRYFVDKHMPMKEKNP